ncbi:MAG: ABC transporter ATP-binding protein [Fidelibacterota bacterium]
MTAPLLELRHLSAYYYTPNGFFKSPKPLQALFNVDLSLFPRQIVAVVGESGCGKSTLGRAIVGLVDRVEGTLLYDGNPFKPEEMIAKGSAIQIIFQDPYSSLNPRLTVGKTLQEVLQFHHSDKIPPEEITRLLAAVQLPPVVSQKYPYELSGGQRQRVCIARALAVSPKVLICDEIVSALDVSVQGRILNLLKTLNQEQNLALLFTTHDLRLVRSFAHYVVVMYLGTIVEAADTAKLFRDPQHPYTQALLSSIPGSTGPRIRLPQEIPHIQQLPTGCRFHPRCPIWNDGREQLTYSCAETEPKDTVLDDSHVVQCHAVSGGDEVDAK